VTTLLCKEKKATVAKCRYGKTGLSHSRQTWQNILREAMAQIGCFVNDDNDDGTGEFCYN
jgi:hypothetical protein